MQGKYFNTALTCSFAKASSILPLKEKCNMNLVILPM